MTQSPPNSATPNSAAPNPPASAPQEDDLGHLYKMSRTAGLGSAEYVAINPMAITAMIFAVASLLVIIDEPLLLVVPAVGLVFCLVAIKQIRGSGGTQTGIPLAVIAMVMSLALLGFKGGRAVLASMQTADDKHQVMALVDNVGTDLEAMTPQSLDDAYSKFSPKFVSRVSRDQFGSVWTLTKRYFGDMTELHSNGQIHFEADPITGENMAVSIGVAAFSRGGEKPRWQMVFRQVGGKWTVEDMPEIFPPVQPQPPSSGRGRP